MRGRTVTRADLVAVAYSECGLAREEVEDLVRATFREISDALVRGEAVKISRFATFAPRRSKLRIGRNPRDPGIDVPITPRVAVRFKAAGELKHHVRTGKPE